MEWVGVVALALSGLLRLMCGGYFWFVSRRIDLRPEDRDDGEIADGAGEIGFFSPGSYYPFGLGLATVTAGVGLVYLCWWLIAAGLVAVLAPPPACSSSTTPAPARPTKLAVRPGALAAPDFIFAARSRSAWLTRGRRRPARPGSRSRRGCSRPGARRRCTSRTWP